MLAAISRTRLRPSSTPKSLSPFALHSPIEFSAKTESERNQPRQLANVPARVILFSFHYFLFCIPWEKDDRHFIEQFQLFRNPAHYDVHRSAKASGETALRQSPILHETGLERHPS